MPACFIILAHEKQGYNVVYSLHPKVLEIPTSNMADYYP